MSFKLIVLFCLSFEASAFEISLNTLTGVDNSQISSKPHIRYPRQTSDVRKQPVYSSSQPFPCWTPYSNSNNTIHGIPPRGYITATSVHALQPSDISVIGAMGDSLVAGNGALDEWALGAIFEYRGVSWAAGGDSTWRDTMTLPNILREYNPQLTGFSTGVGEFRNPNSNLNIGFPVSSAMDALMQAKELVRRMKRNRNINFQNDWKMITVFFGANDLCSVECFRKDLASPEAYTKHIQRGLDYLQENLPRAFINVVPVIDVTVSVRVQRSPMCHFLHRLFCVCFHKGSYDHVNYLGALTVGYQQTLGDLVASGRYDKRDDFTVVMQPFIKLFNLPNDPARKLAQVIDVSYITHDCFHFSQKGHALATNLIWNNLLEPVGNKTTVNMDYIMQRFLCPSERAPYFFTSKNSKTFYATGHQ